MREALRLMGERDMLWQIRIEELRGEIQKGIDQIERGEYVEGEDVFRLLKERNAEIRKKSE